MDPRRIVIIADDLTGAADAGAAFAQAGWLAMIALPPAVVRPRGDVLAISTESRYLPRDDAMARVRRAAEWALGNQTADEMTLVYKKVDSTLRGRPGPELAAVMEATGLERALVAPAFPAQGRTTLGGRQSAGGVAVEHTAFGSEVRSSDLLAVFDDGTHPARLVELSTVRHGPDHVFQVLNRFGPGIAVADAETDSDLATIAQAARASGVRLLCGSAGLARALAVMLPDPPDSVRQPPTLPHPHGPVLVVAGSRQPATARQVAYAQGRGAALVRPGRAFLSADRATVKELAKQVTAYADGGRDVILSSLGLDDSPLGSQAVADRLAQVAAELAAGGRIGGLVLTGGDIAAAVCNALGASILWLRGETEPGIAWGTLVDGVLPGLAVVTKAGGFGTDTALTTAIERCRLEQG